MTFFLVFLSLPKEYVIHLLVVTDFPTQATTTTCYLPLNSENPKTDATIDLMAFSTMWRTWALHQGLQGPQEIGVVCSLADPLCALWQRINHSQKCHFYSGLQNNNYIPFWNQNKKENKNYTSEYLASNVCPP